VQSNLETERSLQTDRLGAVRRHPALEHREEEQRSETLDLPVNRKDPLMSESDNSPTELRPPQPVARDQDQVARDKLATSSYRFEELAAGNNQVYIEFRGKQYVLRRTRTGGLILNKQ
jgi:hemin uptake protein HemP